MRGSGAVPGLDREETIGDNKTASNKNAKRREARKKAKASEDGAPREDDVEEKVNGSTLKETDSHSVTKENSRAPAPTTAPELDPRAEREKVVRNLKKKLRQAKELKDKKDQGDSLLPEQFEKVIKINELIRQLDNLGFNSDGEPKRD